MLSTIDMARAKGQKGEQLSQVIAKAVRDFMPATQTGGRKDIYSHFILRLAYCRRFVDARVLVSSCSVGRGSHTPGGGGRGPLPPPHPA